MSSGDYWYKIFGEVEHERDAYKEFLEDLSVDPYQSDAFRKEVLDLLNRFKNDD